MKTLFFTLLPLLGFAQKNKDVDVKSHEVEVFMDGKKEHVSFKTFDGIEISSNCFAKSKDSPSCLAYSQSKKKFPFPNDGAPYAGNPAASFCKVMNGKALVGSSKNSNSIDLCYFSDKSFVKAWGVFYRHYPQKVIK